jgi:hypothetical protein
MHSHMEGVVAHVPYLCVGGVPVHTLELTEVGTLQKAGRDGD